MAHSCETFIFPRVHELFCRALSLHSITSRSSGGALEEDKDPTESLKADIDAFLHGIDISDAEERGWMLEEPLRALLDKAVAGTRFLNFNMVSTLDGNSRGLYAALINSLRRKLEEESGEW